MSSDRPMFTAEQVAALLQSRQAVDPSVASRGYAPDEMGQFHCDPSDPNCAEAMRRAGLLPNQIAQGGFPTPTPTGGGQPPIPGGGSSAGAGGGLSGRGGGLPVGAGSGGAQGGQVGLESLEVPVPAGSLDSAPGDPRDGTPMAGLTNDNQSLADLIERLKQLRGSRGLAIPLGPNLKGGAPKSINRVFIRLGGVAAGAGQFQPVQPVNKGPV